VTNKQRVRVARDALRSASARRGEKYVVGEEAVTDLLADLQHFCAAEKLDFDRLLRSAQGHFEEETGLWP